MDRAPQPPPRAAARAVLLWAGAALVVALLGKWKLIYLLGGGAGAAASLLMLRRGAASGIALAAALPAAFITIRVAAYCLYPSAERPLASIAIPGIVTIAWMCALSGGGPEARTRRVALRAGIVIVAADAALVGAERIAQCYSPRDPYGFAAEPGSASESLYVTDPLLVRRHAPGFRGRFVHPEYRRELFVINEDGYRDVPWPRGFEDGESRILLLGDSTSVGLGVEQPETIAALASAALREAAPERKIRVLNAAVASYGPRHYFHQLEALHERARPSIVCIIFYDGNDLEDCRAQFLAARENGLASGLLRSERIGGGPAPEARTLGAPRAHSLLDREYWLSASALFRILDARLAPALARAGLVEPIAVFNYPLLFATRREPDLQTEDDYDLARGAIRAGADLCRRNNLKLLLARLPAKIQTEPRRFVTLLERHGLDPAAFDRNLPGTAILAYCKEIGVAALDLMPALEAQGGGGNPLYFEEGHPNRAGNAAIARALAAALGD